MDTRKRDIDAVTAKEASTLPDMQHALTEDTDAVIFSYSPEAEALREELASERDARLRLAAEYENYRRRTKQEKSAAADEGKRELLNQMLTIADELDLALGHSSEETGWLAEWLKAFHRRFHELLEANGVVGIESAGLPFDPRRHEAFDVRLGTEYAAGTVHTDLRRGYSWNGELLRPALVIVAK